jgi:hypothetical protein
MNTRDYFNGNEFRIRVGSWDYDGERLDVEVADVLGGRCELTEQQVRDLISALRLALVEKTGPVGRRGLGSWPLKER